MDFNKVSLSCPSNSPLKRRQTVTVLSPTAGRKFVTAEEKDQRHSPILGSSPVTNGVVTPPYSHVNEFRTPNNYASPIPSRLKGIPVTLAEIDNGDDDDSALLPDYLFSPIPTRRSLFKRVAHLNQDFGSRQHQPHSLQASKSRDSWRKNKQGINDRENSSEMLLLASQKQKFDYNNDSSDEENELPQDLHWEAIERILYIYAKLNPGVGYVQGMNEILGPLYYLLAIDPKEDSQAHAEAESFWLFHLLMSHSRDHFVRSLDRDRTSGIGSTIARMNLRLKEFDEQLWRNLEEKGIAPEYYSFRWLTVLFTQEFEVPDVWRIWDSVLADTCGEEKQDDFLLDFGCAMVCQVRTDLVNGDFADNIKLLQNYPPVDIQSILQLAIIIRELRINGSHDYTTLESDSKGNSNRPSIDLRIWSARPSANDCQNDLNHNSKAFLIDGVHVSDRLDHNLEGIDQRSLSYRTKPGLSRKERPPSMSGLNIEGMWLKANDSESSNSNFLNVKQPSPSSLSVDNYPIENGSRPQTSTWSETFAQIKLRFVGSGSSTSNATEGEVFGTLSPSVEL
ncbi:hypothetical protein BGZ76_006370 [Entomortierella beljakovae]|nr:hypothetical protein BGZ76_006370 [Entomortierella beljakovae]